MKTLIVDDERQAVSALKADIKHHCSELNLVGEAYSVQEAIDKIREISPNLIFLDIQLSDGTGFDVLEAVQDHKLRVIFTTAYNEFAIKAIKWNALDYLLKPIDADDLKQAVKKALKYSLNEGISEQFEMLRQQIDSLKMKENKIVLRDSKSIYLINVADVIRCEARGAYTEVYTNDRPKIIVSKTLKDLETMLKDDGFIRTHHSHLVNLQYIKRVDKTHQGTILLHDNSSIPISQRKWDQVIQLLSGQ